MNTYFLPQKIKAMFFLVLMLGTLFLAAPSSVQALSVTVAIPEKYTEVNAGERAYFSIEIKYPENDKRKDLKFNYQVKKGDEVIAESKVLKAVETQASFIDYIVIPDSVKNGLYTISVQISDYENLNQDVSATFKVVEKTNPFLIYFFIILGVIVVLGIIISLEINRLKTYLK